MSCLHYVFLLQEETETTVMSGYVNRLYGGKTDHKFCKLISNNVLFMYGAHEVKIRFFI